MAPARRRCHTRFRLLLVAAALLVLAGCRVEVAVDVEARADGTGEVHVGVGVDDETLAAAPGLAERVRVDDLRQAGWRVEPPARGDDGLTWLRASKPFRNPGELREVMAEINGPDGPLRDVSLTRRTPWAREEWTFRADVGLERGLSAFADQAVVDLVGGVPFTEAVARTGRPLEEVVGLEVSVDLPGGSPRPVRWQPDLAPGEARTLEATDTAWRTTPLVASASGAAASVLLVAVLGRRAIRLARRATR